MYDAEGKKREFTGYRVDATTDFALEYLQKPKDKPFFLMESCPSATNWQPYSHLKRPGVLEAASLEAVAHGSDSVLFFQMRNSYAAVESRWAMEGSAGPRNAGLHYRDNLRRIYLGLRSAGVDVDVIDSSHSFDAYKLIVVPMLYMFKDGVADRLRKFTADGGTIVVTHWSGVADECDAVYPGPSPHSLTDVLGLYRGEIDALADGVCNRESVSHTAFSRTCNDLQTLFIIFDVFIVKNLFKVRRQDIYWD